MQKIGVLVVLGVNNILYYGCLYSRVSGPDHFWVVLLQQQSFDVLGLVWVCFVSVNTKVEVKF